jgi:glutamate dehydrogenase
MKRDVVGARETIIQKITQEVHKHFEDKQADEVVAFIKQYYRMVSEDDLIEQKTSDLYGAALSHLKFASQRDIGEVKIRVFNPNYEQSGWQSNHTIIEIASDDMPFIVDSVRMALNRRDLTIYIIIHPGSMYFCRDEQGKVIEVLEANTQTTEGRCSRDAIIHIEIARQNDPEVLEAIQKDLYNVMSDVSTMVNDWALMCKKANEALASLGNSPTPVEADELKESIDFIRWIVDGHFTFLGLADYKLVENGDEPKFTLIPESALGLLRHDGRRNQPNWLSDMYRTAREELLSPDTALNIQQLTEQSTVHRPAAPYSIGIKQFDSNGKVIGERRMIGLYTSDAYHGSPLTIPILRRKVGQIIIKSGLEKDGHSEKDLLNILETYPRDELFQASIDDLYHVCMGILHMQERRRIRLFIRKDRYGRFYSCLLYVPRDIFTPELREKLATILCTDLNGVINTFTTRLSESILARVHVVVNINPGTEAEYDVPKIEAQMIEASRTWKDKLRDSLIENNGEARGTSLYSMYVNAFQAGYRETFPVRTAVFDIDHMERLTAEEPLGMSFYRPLEDTEGHLNFKIFSLGKTAPLSDVLPMLENMGLRVIGERAHEIHLKDNRSIWISEFRMSHQNAAQIDVEAVRDIFQESFADIWRGDVENDGFNRLVLTAELNSREVTILRAYAKYFRQIGFTFSQNYVEATLSNHPMIARELVSLFKARFNPADREQADQLTSLHQSTILEALDQVSSLDDDRILRRYLSVILATIRTNFYQKDEQDKTKRYLSFKFNSSLIPEMPLPHPLFEIFVYAPWVEGVHLRSSKVARGGLRWSDRREDFRTEVLGLMKAQQVKNSVIVPAGAKGGFVVKNLPKDGDRDAVMTEVIHCYKTFIRGLLDLTDNLEGEKVIPCRDVVRHDGDDFYLVVAADKGTATFSDIANGIANEYNFWLGDAFASGGSAGYDHKKIGITARGAWESVERHFRELGINFKENDFTVVGIGDMSGDVFGNGMLQSPHIQMIAAFNHMHIFLDPNPDSAASFKERERLFNLPRSTWADYDATLISQGGGIYSRQAKSIKITPEVQKVLNITDEYLVPNELIRAILKAPVDLLWNGGIGTYVKATAESNIDVGDRTNDSLRVNGKELRARVVAEGGNLGFTQLGRVEYALNNGISYTDFIDNSGGVDCSDHEVNIKILLDSVVDHGDMTEKQRNQLLADMTDEVAALVLRNNYLQTQAISLAASRSTRTVDEYSRFMSALERNGELNRALEFLPTDEKLQERKLNGFGLTRPEISIVFAYSKNYLKRELLNSIVTDDPYLQKELATAFPARLSTEFGEELRHHRLRREIIATQIANVMTNEMGATFVLRLFDETGAAPAVVTRCFVVAREVFQMDQFLVELKKLDNVVDANVQMQMFTEMIRLVRRATRWFIRNRRMELDIGQAVQEFAPAVQDLQSTLPTLLSGVEKDRFGKMLESYQAFGVPDNMAIRASGTEAMISALDIIEAAKTHQLPLEEVAQVYFKVGDKLKLDWFRDEIDKHMVANTWDALARAACKDDLDRQQRSLTEGVLQFPTSEQSIGGRIDAWLADHQILVERWRYILSDIRATKHREFTMFTVALRELLDLASATRRRVVQEQKG